LTAGEIELNDSDKGKSNGVLYPAAQLVINKEGQIGACTPGTVYGMCGNADTQLIISSD
jgi:hypothetical protein